MQYAKKTLQNNTYDFENIFEGVALTTKGKRVANGLKYILPNLTKNHQKKQHSTYIWNNMFIQQKNT